MEAHPVYALRQDYPGARWFSTNRGIAKRPVVEARQDVERLYDALRDVAQLGFVDDPLHK